jgi:hypothetical protein
MDHTQIADIVSKVTGRNVVYAPSTIPEYRELLKKYDLSEFMIQHFEEVAVDYQNGVFAGTNDVIARITGTPPQTVEEFVATNRHAFDA